jgi:hypothetical protein
VLFAEQSAQLMGKPADVRRILQWPLRRCTVIKRMTHRLVSNRARDSMHGGSIVARRAIVHRTNLCLHGAGDNATTGSAIARQAGILPADCRVFRPAGQDDLLAHLQQLGAAPDALRRRAERACQGGSRMTVAQSSKSCLTLYHEE